MAVREFAGGSSSFITVDNGTVTAINNSAAWSIVMVVKPLEVAATGQGLMAIRNTTSTDIISPYTNVTDLWIGSLLDDEGVSVGLTVAWQVLAVTKPTGAAQLPRFHRKVLGSGSWTQTNSGGTWSDTATAADSVVFGAFASQTSGKNMRLATVAVWQGTNLSDGQVQGIESTATTAGINALAPTALWDFNQASTGTNVTDLTGNGADQTALTGTTVATGDDPAWTFGLGGPAGNPTPIGQVRAAPSISRW